MTSIQPLTNSQSLAKEVIEQFRFKKRLEEVFDEKDESLIPILTTNLAIFGVASSILFNVSDNELSASILLILIAAIIALLGALLNIWYLIRLKTRIDFLKKEQENVFHKAEANIIKTFDLLKKIVKVDINQKIEGFREKGLSKDELLDKLKDDTTFDFLAEDSTFIPFTIMELALKETKLNIHKCLNEPLNEGYAGLKLFIDKLSSRVKNVAVALAAAFMLAATLIEFILG